MKKKQKQKLLQRFRPSYEVVRQQLFEALEQKAYDQFDLKINVYISPKNREELMIENLGETQREKVLSVPMDKNFVTLLKRIQKQEAGLMDRFSGNLVNEIANYWSAVPQTAVLAEPTTPAPAKAQSETSVPEPAVVESVDESTTEAAETVKATSAFSEFVEKIKAFPKFFVEETDEAIFVKEKAAKEDRLLATISQAKDNDYTIEKALERKYKLKTEVIPVIEDFAQVPVTNR